MALESLAGVAVGDALGLCKHVVRVPVPVLQLPGLIISFLEELVEVQHIGLLLVALALQTCHNLIFHGQLWFHPARLLSS